MGRGKDNLASPGFGYYLIVKIKGYDVRVSPTQTGSLKVSA